MKNAIARYMKNEEAAEDIQVVILTVVGLGCAVAVGWWIWNVLSNNANKSKCGSNNASPFCVE